MHPASASKFRARRARSLRRIEFHVGSLLEGLLAMAFARIARSQRRNSLPTPDGPTGADRVDLVVLCKDLGFLRGAALD
jgi:hypothetical protein